MLALEEIGKWLKYNNVRALENNSPFLINSSSKMDANGILRDAMLTVVDNPGVFS